MEGSAADSLALQSEPEALLVGEANALGAKVFPEHTVFLEQVLNGVLLVAVHPTSKCEQEEVERGRAHAVGMIAYR